MIQSLRYLVLSPTDDGESPHPKHQASFYSYINYRYVTTGADPTYSHFMHLELRNQIYEYALIPNRPIDIWPIVLKVSIKIIFAYNISITYHLVSITFYYISSTKWQGRAGGN